MKLSCNKCKKILTEDLRPFTLKYKIDSKGLPYISNTNQLYKRINDEDGTFSYDGIKQGIFYVTRSSKENWTYEDSGIEDYFEVIHHKSYIGVSGYSIVEGVIPEFREGGGCCNWAMGRSLQCECGNELGGMHLDCYEDGEVRFNPKSVDRVYKK